MDSTFTRNLWPGPGNGKPNNAHFYKASRIYEEQHDGRDLVLAERFIRATDTQRSKLQRVNTAAGQQA